MNSFGVAVSSLYWRTDSCRVSTLTNYVKGRRIQRKRNSDKKGWVPIIRPLTCAPESSDPEGLNIWQSNLNRIATYILRKKKKMFSFTIKMTQKKNTIIKQTILGNMFHIHEKRADGIVGFDSYHTHFDVSINVITYIISPLVGCVFPWESSLTLPKTTIDEMLINCCTIAV